MPQGWIKLHRKLLDKAFCSKPSYLALWVHILLMANHSGKEFMWNGQVMRLKEGQFITGRKILSETTGVPETTIERILDFFEKEQQIGQQKTTKYRLITVLKWDTYQIRTTNGQQTDTNKNEKKEKNIGEANASQELPTNSKKDMGWTPRVSDNDDDLDVIDIETGEPAKPKQKVVRHYKEVYEVFKHFGMYSLDWTKNRTEQKAGDDLYTEKGLEQVEKALRLYKENKDQEFCPLIYSPSTLIRKWKSLLEFKKKQEHG